MAAQKKNYTVIIVQARMGSTRLPGKSMMEILDRPMLSYTLERLKRCKYADEIMVATTNHPRDKKIVDFCRSQNTYSFVGSEEDVLDRYYQAALASGADVIVRVTGDCPFVDPTLIDSIVDNFNQRYPAYDYASNVMKRTYPRGLDVEVFSMRCLEQMNRYARAPEEREHVTLYVHNHPDRFKVMSITQDEDASFHRWTVDTEDDFKLAKLIIEELYPVKRDFSTKDILLAFEKNPKWIGVNAHIQQKKI
ncbi:MAG: glycosyltransferase family protein [Chlamydiota bacterium]|nr:glycosyltransferase family protein [Chlamydiota bacterium]